MTEAKKLWSVESIGLLRDYATLLRRVRHRREARNIQKQAAEESMQLLNGDSALKYSVDVSALSNKHY